MTVARRILAENPGRTEQVLVVFNNHRPELFLREQFKKISAAEGKSFFLPKTMVIDDLVAQMSGLEVVPPEFLIFELYRIHTELEGDERKYQTFEEFIPFGEMMLSDFSEVDRYMVDARDLFQNLHGLKQLGEWNIEDPLLPLALPLLQPPARTPRGPRPSLCRNGLPQGGRRHRSTCRPI